MKREQVRAFVDRDWEAVDALRRREVAARYRERGPAGSLRVAHELFQHARQLRPGFPDERLRAKDLEHHVALKALLRRASDAIAVP